MAGRGTDIKLTPEARRAGGLAIIGTERHESRRVDRQLRGRAGRQGDVGSSQFFIALEDNLMRMFSSGNIAKVMDKIGLQEGEVIQHSMITRSIERAQKRVEEGNFSIRKRLLEYDNVMNAQREVIYTKRKHALLGHRLHLDLLCMMQEVVEEMMERHTNPEALHAALVHVWGTAPTPDTYPAEKMSEHLQHVGMQLYTQKKKAMEEVAASFTQKIQVETLGNFVVPFSDGSTELPVVIQGDALLASQGKSLAKDVEKATVLHCIDTHWKEHLREMDELKQSVQNAVYEQKDPLLVYKFEAYQLFQKLLCKINSTTIGFLCKATLLEQPDNVQHVPTTPSRHLQEGKENATSLLESYTNETQPVPIQPRQSQKIATRNQRVTVRYTDGTIKENVKFKTVDEDLVNERCVMVTT